MDADLPPRHRRGAWLWAAAILGPFFVLALLVFIKERHDHAWLEERVRQGSVWYNARWGPIPESDNRFFAYERWSRTPWNSSWTQGVLNRRPRMGDRWPEPDGLLREFILSHETWHEEFLENQSKLGFRLPDSRAGDLVSFLNVRVLDLVSLRAWLDLRDGRRDETIDRLLAADLFFRDQLRTGFIISIYSSMGFRIAVLEPLVVEFSRSGWTPEQLRRFADAFDLDLSDLPAAPDALRVEQLGGARLLADPAFRLADARDWFKFRDPPRDPACWEPLRYSTARRYIEFMDRRIAAMELPRAEQGPANDRLDAEVASLPDWDPHNYMVHCAVVPRLDDWKNPRILLAKTRLFVAALRLQAFELEHGRYPDTLRELPGHGELPGVESPRIAHRPDGSLCIYLLGRNGKDDGGRNASRACDASDPLRVMSSQELQAERQRRRDQARVRPRGPPPPRPPDWDDYSIELGPLSR